MRSWRTDSVTAGADKAECEWGAQHFAEQLLAAAYPVHPAMSKKVQPSASARSSPPVILHRRSRPTSLYPKPYPIPETGSPFGRKFNAAFDN